MQSGVIFAADNQEISVEADILDISQAGIKVKFRKIIAANIVGRVKITMNLPDSRMPFSVHGILKHQHIDIGCAVHSKVSIDDFIFECVELDASTVLIKTL